MSAVVQVLALLMVLSAATDTYGSADTILLDQRDEIPLPPRLPTLMVEPTHSGALDPDQWLHQPFSVEQFGESSGSGPMVGWHRIDLIASDAPDGPSTFCIAAQVHILQHLSYFLYDGNELVQTGRFGLLDPETAERHRGIRSHPGPCFCFQVSPGERYRLLIRKQNDGPKVLPLRLFSEAGALRWQETQFLVWGMVIAMLLTMALYNLVIYALDRNKAYAWYLAFHATAFVYFGALTGYGILIWPFALQSLVAQHIPTLNFVLLLVVLNFARALLDAKTYAPRHGRLVQSLSAAIAVGGLLSLVLPGRVMEPVFGATFAIVAGFSLAMAWRAHRNGSRAARFFILSWVFTIAGGAIGFGAYTQLLPQTIFTLNAFLIGTLCELFLFSVALAFRAKDRERRALELSLRYPGTDVASFGYVKWQLPRYLRQIQGRHGEPLVLIAQLSGYRELVGIYGPAALARGFRRQTEDITAYLATQSWTIPMPMPTGAPVYLAALPGEQLFLLADQSRLNEPTDLATAIAQLADAVERFSFGKSLKIKTRMTIGVSNLQGGSIDLAYSQAQIALLTALAQGERWLFHAEAMSHEVERRASMATELQQLVAGDQLRLYIQPQVYLDSGRLRGAEILIRWNNPRLGLVAPTELIALAEQSGDIYRITQHVVERACSWLAGLPHRHPLSRLPLSVNLSALDLEEAGLPDFIDDALATHGLQRHRLMLEITESAAARNAGRFLESIARLKARGFLLSIDDFGTGYSTLQYLRDIAPHELKIDMAFVRDVHRDASKQRIIEAVIRMAQATSAEVIAEGIESADEAAELLRLGCKLGQGFLWQAPMPLGAFSAQYADRLEPARHSIVAAQPFLPVEITKA